MRQTHTAFALATLLLLAGCSGGKEAANPQDHGAKSLGLGAKWDDVTDLQDYGAEQGYRFFKVDVELP